MLSEKTAAGQITKLLTRLNDRTSQVVSAQILDFKKSRLSFRINLSGFRSATILLSRYFPRALSSASWGLGHPTKLHAPRIIRGVANPCRPASTGNIHSTCQVQFHLPKNPQTILIRITLPSHSQLPPVGPQLYLNFKGLR